MYGKIYEQTFTGSMVGSGSHVFAVWGYVIAHTKPDSMVELNPTLLAAVIGDEVERVKMAISILCSPDPDSRSKSFDGCRLIEKAPFIYFVPQYRKYHGLPNDAARRQYFAEKQREHRQRVADCQTASSKPSKNVKQSETETKTESPPNPLKGEDTARKAPASDASEFLEKLKAMPAYKGIDIEREISRMKAWLLTPKARGRKLTRGFVVNWLNKIDVPIAPSEQTKNRADRDWEELQERKKSKEKPSG